MFKLDEVTKKYGIGLTGGIATGKSVVAKILRDLGYHVFDADQLSRRVVEPGSACLAKIVGVFGGAVLDANGALDRAKMRSLIFENEDKRRALETIVHPALATVLESLIVANGLDQKKTYWFYEAALLIETGSYKKFNAIWLTYCDPITQVERLVARDHVTPLEAQKIIQSQYSFAQKSQCANFLIDTSQSIPQLTRKIKAELEDLQSRLTP